MILGSSHLCDISGSGYHGGIHAAATRCFVISSGLPLPAPSDADRRFRNAPQPHTNAYLPPCEVCLGAFRGRCRFFGDIFKRTGFYSKRQLSFSKINQNIFSDSFSLLTLPINNGSPVIHAVFVSHLFILRISDNSSTPFHVLLPVLSPDQSPGYAGHLFHVGDAPDLTKCRVNAAHLRVEPAAYDNNLFLLMNRCSPDLSHGRLLFPAYCACSTCEQEQQQQ